MTDKCEKCGGHLIKGFITGMHTTFFYPEEEIKKFKPKRSQIICYCCKDCGSIQGLQVNDPNELK